MPAAGFTRASPPSLACSRLPWEAVKEDKLSEVSMICSLRCYLHPNDLMVLETPVPAALPVISCCLSSLYL